jgi:hypothetical protein
MPFLTQASFTYQTHFEQSEHAFSLTPTLPPEPLGWVIASMLLCSLVCMGVIVGALRPHRAR